MGSVKVVLQKSYQNKKGETAVVIQVTHQYKTKRKKLFFIPESQWSGDQVKKSHRDHVQLNNKIRTTLNEFESRIAQLENRPLPYSVHDIFQERKNIQTLHDAITNYANLQEDIGKHRNSRKITNVADKVKSFDHHISLDLVNSEWLDRFQSYIRNLTTVNSEATVAKYMKFIKTVLRHEFSEGRYSDQKAINYKIPSYKVIKERLTREEFDTWRKKDVSDRLLLYRDFFTAMVYLRGIRVGDALQLQYEDVSEGRIIVKEQKTGKVQNIKIIPELQEILDRYHGQSQWYLFPLLKQSPQDPKKDLRFQKHIESKTTILNRKYEVIAAAAEIKKKVTNHIARHTFTTFADKSGVDTATISKMLNHSSIKVTEIYLGELRRSDELDDAADKVFG